jgi:hypothetical protein
MTKIENIIDRNKVLSSLHRTIDMENLKSEGGRFENCRYCVEVCGCLTDDFMKKDSITRKAMIIDFQINNDWKNTKAFVEGIREDLYNSTIYNYYILKHNKEPKRVGNLLLEILDGINNLYHDSVFDNRFGKDSFESDYARYLDEVYDVYRKELLKC